MSFGIFFIASVSLHPDQRRRPEATSQRLGSTVTRLNSLGETGGDNKIGQTEFGSWCSFGAGRSTVGTNRSPGPIFSLPKPRATGTVSKPLALAKGATGA